GSEGLSQVLSDASDSVIGFGHVAGPDLMRMQHLGEQVKANVDPGASGDVGQAMRVVDEYVPVAGLDIQRRQVGEIAVEGRGVGIPRILAGKELLRAPPRASRVLTYVNVGTGRQTLGSHREIDPGRQKHT